MGTDFWGLGGIAQSPAETGQTQQVDPSYVIRETLRDPASGAYFPPQNASPTAQTAGGIGIQNVKRGFLNITTAYDPSVVGTDFQTTSTAYGVVSSELIGSLETSGRPLMVIVRGNAGIPTGYATISATINGDEITGGDGMTRVYPSNQATFFGMFVVTPSSGTQNLAMVWKTSTGGNVLMPRSCRPSLIAVEI